MRIVHLGLFLLIVAVCLVGYYEKTPELKDFDPAKHEDFKATWDKRTHISYWEKWTSFEGEACQAMVDEFNKSQDEVFVHLITVSQINRKAMLAIIGGDPPDVFGPFASDIPPFANAGAILPLDQLMDESGIKRDDYTDNYLALGLWDGKIFGLPTTPSSSALFYNKEHFGKRAADLEKVGLDPNRPPITIDELDRYAAVLNEFESDGTPRIMGFLPTEPGWFNEFWGYFCGGTLFDPTTEKVTADCPENIAAYCWLKRYAEQYGRENLLRFRSGFGSFDSPQNAFIDGRVSMEMQGVWFPNFIRRHRPQLEFGVAPFPCAQGVPGPRGVIDSDMICIPKGCKHPEAAWKFVHFVETKGLPILCRLQGKHTPLKHPPAWFYESHPNLELRVFEETASSPYSFCFPRVSVREEYAHEIGMAFEHVWNWKPPDQQLVGLDPEPRAKKVEELCRSEIERTLKNVREVIQSKYDEQKKRDMNRSGADRP